MIKVPKKIERLARGLAYVELIENGHMVRGAEVVHDMVDERWPSWVKKAKDLDAMIQLTPYYCLDGGYDENHEYRPELNDNGEL